MKELAPYLSCFEDRERRDFAVAPVWLRLMRKAGIARFAELGFPTTRHEDWKYTSVAPLQRLPFKLLSRSTSTLRPEVIAPFSLELKGPLLVFINGYFTQTLSIRPPGEGQVILGNLATAVGQRAHLVERHLGRYARIEQNPFTALNNALHQDGALVVVPTGKVFPTPIHILCLMTSEDRGASAQLRHLIVLEPNSQATVLEHYVSLVGSAHFTNAVTEIVLGEDAYLEHCRIQQESEQAFHIGAVQADQGPGSQWLSHSISIGARLARHEIATHLGGEGAGATLNGLYVGAGDQMVDHHTLIEHAKPHCTSHEYYSGILSGKARGVFNGKIHVHPEAQKTDAKQTNRNLLLSDRATIHTKPQLEIFADDVKCTHGATVGQLDAEALFYMQTRGLAQKTARQLLIQAFAGEILGRIRLPSARTGLNGFVLQHLAKALEALTPVSQV